MSLYIFTCIACRHQKREGVLSLYIFTSITFRYGKRQSCLFIHLLVYPSGKRRGSPVYFYIYLYRLQTSEEGTMSLYTCTCITFRYEKRWPDPVYFYIYLYSLQASEEVARPCLSFYIYLYSLQVSEEVALSLYIFPCEQI